MDLTSNSIKIPISATGSLTFIYGSNPVSCGFNQNGVWNITFSSDWNSITSVNYLGNLPNNRMYYSSNSQDNSSQNYVLTEKGFPLTVDVPVQSGLNSIQIYANSTIAFNSTVLISDNTTFVPCQIQTTGMTIGNYSVTAKVNNGANLQVETAGITYVGDLNGDFKVDGNDFLVFMNAYVSYNSVNGSQYSSFADFNFDGKIDSNDFFAFLNAYIIYNNVNK